MLEGFSRGSLLHQLSPANLPINKRHFCFPLLCSSFMLASRELLELFQRMEVRPHSLRQVILYYLKRNLRTFDARTCFRTRKYDLSFAAFSTFDPWLWRPPGEDVASRELGPYFDASASCSPKTIIDAGAAVGLFAIPALLKWPNATVFGFEPGLRQRILLKRNARLNRVSERLTILPLGCWNSDTRLPYRAQAEMGGFEGADQLPHGMLHPEELPVVKLDTWWSKQGKPHIDLLKMDIEGAEIEALEGAQAMLLDATQCVMVEAYHVRAGEKTLVACTQILERVGFDIDPSYLGLGLIVGRK